MHSDTVYSGQVSKSETLNCLGGAPDENGQEWGLVSERVPVFKFFALLVTRAFLLYSRKKLLVATTLLYTSSDALVPSSEPCYY